MWVVSKKTLLFQKERFVDDPVTKERKSVVDDTFTLVPNIGENALVPVEAPDWIKQTDLYKLCRKEKSIWESADGGKSDGEDDEEDDKGKGVVKPADTKTGLQKQAEHTGWQKK